MPQSQRVKRGSVFYGPADHNAGSGHYSESGRKPRGSFVRAGEALELPHRKNHSHAQKNKVPQEKHRSKKAAPEAAVVTWVKADGRVDQDAAAEVGRGF